MSRVLRRLRAIWRAARDWPVLGGIAAAADRAWWARVIDRADVVDEAYVCAQLGGRTHARAAVRRYVRGGFRTGLSLNPLIVEQRVSRQLPDAGRVPALYAYLVNDQRAIDVSPVWDAVAYAERHPESVLAPGGPLGHMWRAARRSGEVALGRGDEPATVPWEKVSETANDAAQEVRAIRALRGGAHPDTASIHVTFHITSSEPAPDEALELAAEMVERLDADVMVEISRPTAELWTATRLMALTNRRIGICMAEAAASAPRDAGRARRTIVERGPGAEISADDLVALARAATERPVAPLWVGLDGTVASAGTVVHDGRRVHLLRGHPAEDARALGPVLEVAEVSGRTWARPSAMPMSSARARTLLSLTVTAPDEDPERAPTDQGDDDVNAMLSPTGLSVREWRAGVPLLQRRRETVTLADGEIVPRWRWAVKTAAPTGPRGETWGDTHFARGLAEALRRLGQEVVVDAYPSRRRPSSEHLDDVVLALRGPHRIDPPRSALSLLWVISHPDEIGRDELSGFDAVFAASIPWAMKASRRFERPVLPLLQCTDATRFHPTGARRTHDIVFVGTARGIPRPSVVGPIRAGVPVKVYGPDWRGYIPAGSIAATGIDNRELARRYETAGVVLNDHWPAMKAEGFISNRPYDVVAAGGRVLSDDVDGIESEFGGAVRTYASVEELIALLSGDLGAIFPPDSELARISADVRLRSSFDARARVLLDHARNLGP